MKTRLALISLLLAVHLAPLFAEEVALRWVQLPNSQMEVDGLPWYAENGGELFRLPTKLKDTYRPAVLELAKSPSGGRIPRRWRFASTTRNRRA